MALTFAIAIAVGFGTSLYMLENGRQITAKQYGPWYGWPDAGIADIDPYLKAYLARSSSLQMGRAEGVIFAANTDDLGEPLTGSCSYTIEGKTPQASVWSMFIDQKSGEDDTPNVTYLLSSEINWNADQTFSIYIAPTVKAGNWLEMPNAEFVQFNLTFYDTNAFNIVGQELESLPSINKVECS